MRRAVVGFRVAAVARLATSTCVVALGRSLAVGDHGRVAEGRIGVGLGVRRCASNAVRRLGGLRVTTT